MGFSYAPKNPAARDKVRRKIGDTQAANPVFQDEELDAILVEASGDVLMAAATACREMAQRAALGAVIVTLPGVTISGVSQPGIFLDMADRYEREAFQRAEPDQVTLRPETDDLIDTSLGRQDVDLDFATSEDEA
jgi:hypothetical protein